MRRGVWIVTEYSPAGQVPWRMQYRAWADHAAVERRKLERRPPWWLLWTVTAVGAASWPAAFVVAG